MEQKTIGAFIAALRKANGLTQKQLAEQLNVSEKSISRWERNETSPDLALIPVIAELFSITSDELLRGERRETAVPIPSPVKSEKRIAYMFKRTLTRHHIHSIIAAGISLCGVIPVLLLYGRISHRYFIWVLAVAIVVQLAAVICQLGFTTSALSAIDSDDFICDALYTARNTMLNRALWVICPCILWTEILLFILFLNEFHFGVFFTVLSALFLLFLCVLFKRTMHENGFLGPQKNT